MKHVQLSESFLEDEKKHQLINVVQKYKRQSRILLILAIALVAAIISSTTYLIVRGKNMLRFSLMTENRLSATSSNRTRT
jgi:hypothetical protein